MHTTNFKPIQISRIRSSPGDMINFQLLEAFHRIISRLGTNRTCHIEESLFKPRIQVRMLNTFYLADSALCNDTVLFVLLRAALLLVHTPNFAAPLDEDICPVCCVYLAVFMVPSVHYSTLNYNTVQYCREGNVNWVQFVFCTSCLLNF